MSLLSTAPAPPNTQPPAPPNPYEQLIGDGQQTARAFYDALGERAVKWNTHRHYVRDQIARFLRHIVPRGARVLDVGCGCGDLLDALGPSEGVGIDGSGAMIGLARHRHADLTFVNAWAESLDHADVPEGPYDYVTMVNVVNELPDPGLALRQVLRYCSAQTRIVLAQPSALWEPVCSLAAEIGWFKHGPDAKWFSLRELDAICRLSGYEVVRAGHRLPLPVRVPGLNWLANGVLGKLPVLRRLGFVSYAILRPTVPLGSADRYSCSVVVPCKNEQDNIAGLVERIPEMGAWTEIVFVDDQSTDETADRIDQAMRNRPDRNIRIVTGPGQGKGAACRAGFDAATGDVFMILDADMTVMPEELPAFFEAITSGKGEFINGSRMVYPRQDEAMRPMNVLGNKMFAALFSLLLDQRIRDTLCGTKVIWRRDYGRIMAARDYFKSCDAWGDYDWIFGAARNHLKIVELPVHYRDRIAGVTKMTNRFRNAWIMLKMCGLALRKLRWV